MSHVLKRTFVEVRAPPRVSTLSARGRGPTEHAAVRIHEHAAVRIHRGELSREALGH